MNILVRKKILYYILGIVAIVAICMLAPLRIINGAEFSVWNAIWKLPREILNTCTVQDTFNSGIANWTYILMPLIASIPFASCLTDEIQSKFYLYIEGRQGKDSYICSKFFQNIISAGSIALLGLGIFVTIIVLIFPINPIYKNIDTSGLPKMSAGGLTEYIIVNLIHLLLYVISVSLFVSLLVLIYQNLYFDFSVVFILSDILKDFHMQINIIYFMVFIVMMFILHRIVWKIRGEKT